MTEEERQWVKTFYRSVYSRELVGLSRDEIEIRKHDFLLDLRQKEFVPLRNEAYAEILAELLKETI